MIVPVMAADAMVLGTEMEPEAELTSLQSSECRVQTQKNMSATLETESRLKTSLLNMSAASTTELSNHRRAIVKLSDEIEEVGRQIVVVESDLKDIEKILKTQLGPDDVTHHRAKQEQLGQKELLLRREKEQLRAEKNILLQQLGTS
jgi:hypothetical protein